MTSRRTRACALLIAAALGLGGCFATPVTSIPRLMRLDLATMDMNEVRAGLRLPAMLRVRPGDAVMTIKTRVEGAAVSEERFVLAEATEERERSGLAGEAQRGFALSVWRVAPADVPRMAALQERLRASRASGPRIRGSLEVTVSGGCATGAVTPGPVLMSSFLKPARGETYITLLDGLDLRQHIPLADWDQKIPRCAD
jgi:hypothetical protein